MFPIVCLAIVWACFLVPPMLRKHREGRPASSVHSFRRQLSTLERATPGTSLKPLTPYRPQPLVASGTAPALRRTEQQRRRHNVLVALGASTGVSLLLLLVAASAVTFLLFALSAGALGAYVYALVQIRTRAVEASRKVRVLHPQAAAPAAGRPQVAELRRAAAR